MYLNSKRDHPPLGNPWESAHSMWPWGQVFTPVLPEGLPGGVLTLRAPRGGRKRPP